MHTGKVIELCQNRRGTHVDIIFLDETRVMVKYKIPLNEIVEDFVEDVSYGRIVWLAV